MIVCKTCQRPISNDEVGLTKKLINRAIREFYCYECLGKMFKMDEETLKRLVESFRDAGCTLFL